MPHVQESAGARQPAVRHDELHPEFGGRRARHPVARRGGGGQAVHLRAVALVLTGAEGPGERLILLVTSPRVAPGLLTVEAWDALRGAARVLCGSPDHPQLPALAAAGI